MNIVKRIQNAWNTFRSTKEPVSQEDLAKYLRGESVWTGVEVDRSSSLGITAVWACVRVLAETLASLPLILYRRLEGDAKERATDHELYDLLHLKPNSEQSAFTFKEVMQGHLVLQGNCYAHKEMTGAGYVKSLWPLNPEKMEDIKRENSQLVYYYRDGGQIRKIPQEEMFHVPGLGFDGIRGYSPIEIVKQSFGMSIAAEQYGARFFENNAWPGGYVQMKGHLKDKDAMKRFKDTWNDAHKDWGKRHSIGVLEDEAEFKTITIPPEHAQFIETKKFQVNEIARIFRVPPHLIGDLERATFSNIEEQGIEFVVYTMRPWLVRWEQAITLQLIPESDRKEYFCEFLVDALLRGNTLARAQAYRMFIEMGAMTPNEVLGMENRNPYEGGDKHFYPLNWISDEEPRPKQATGAPTEGEVFQEESYNLKEERVKRAAKTRHRISKSYEKLFQEVAGKLIRRQVREIKPAIKEYLSHRSIDDFNLWLDKYYQKFFDVIRNTYKPSLKALAEAVKEEIGDELGIDTKLTPTDEDFINAYVTILARRHEGTDRALIKKRIKQAIDENKALDEEMEAELDEWIEKRPTEIALKETVQGSNALAKIIYLGAGVMYLRWVAIGSDPCPYCQTMDGKLVSIQNDFILPGDEIADGDKSLKVSKNIGHPPLHNGCECQIMAG